MLYELPAAEDRAIWDIWLSMTQAPAMAVADELGVFQVIETRPATAEEAARLLGLNCRATRALLDLLTALGLVIFRHGRYELAEVSRTYLLPRSPYYWGPILRTLGILPHQRGALIRALRGAENDPAVSGGHLLLKMWQDGQMDRAHAESVSRVMHCHSLPAAVAAAWSGSFEGVTRLLDVGGGSGCYSIAIAQHLPHIRCSVMELAAVCEVARSYIEAGGVSNRVDTISVNMFYEAWPHGFDGILFSNVFHDWNAETNLLLARRAYEVLPRGGRIFVHEMLLAEDGSGPITTASFSILMLFGTQGRQYSMSEVRQMLANAGFIDIKVRETYGYFSVVSGQKP